MAHSLAAFCSPGAKSASQLLTVGQIFGFHQPLATRIPLASQATLSYRQRKWRVSSSSWSWSSSSSSKCRRLQVKSRARETTTNHWLEGPERKLPPQSLSHFVSVTQCGWPQDQQLSNLRARASPWRLASERLYLEPLAALEGLLSRSWPISSFIRLDASTNNN